MNTSKASKLTATTLLVAKRIAKRGMNSLVCAAVALLAVGALTANAQSTLTWDITPGTVGAGDSAITGGAGTWNTSNGNWTTDAGVNNIAWINTTPSVNTALFNAAGINGTRAVTLGETINLKALTFSNLRNSGPVQKYTITGGTLAFASGGTITTGTSLDNVNNAEYAYINSTIGAGTLDADIRTDTVGTLDVTAAATIKLGSGAALAFADSSAFDWTDGTLAISGTLADTSLRLGTSSSGLTPTQLALITFDGRGVTIDEDGYILPMPAGTLIPVFTSWKPRSSSVIRGAGR